MVGKFIERSYDFHCSKYNNKQLSAQIFYTQKSINIKSSNSLHNTFIKHEVRTPRRKVVILAHHAKASCTRAQSKVVLSR